MIKSLIFDLDNTLYDYDACNIIAERILFKTIASELGVNEDCAKALLNNAKSNIKKQLGDGVAASHNRLLYMQNICEQVGKNPLEYAVMFYDVYWESMIQKMIPFSYVKPLFSELHLKGIKIGVLTDLTAHIQYRKLETLGVSQLVDYLVTSEEAGAEKPSAKMFNLMIKKLGNKPEEILMIGDSEKKDIAGAEAVGMKTILFKRDSDVSKEIKEILYSEK